MHKAEHLLTWEQLCSDRSLRDLPFKIELNARNQIVMGPLYYRHGLYQAKIVVLLARLMKGGSASVEAAMQTSENVKVPDVVWAPDEFVRQYADEYALPLAPPICIEILSPSNTEEEITAKRSLYFERGAVEVWVCEQDGAMLFYRAEAALAKSVLCPKFPRRIKV